MVRAGEIRVIDDEKKPLGVMTAADALVLARQRGLDLVEIAPTATPPVCRIMDYGKFRYAQKKKAQESRKKGAASQLKEVKMGSQTSVHDVTFKVNHIRDFLGEGHRVKVTVFFRGRSITHPELGHAMLDKVAGLVTDVAAIEQSARLEGRHMSMMLVSK